MSRKIHFYAEAFCLGAYECTRNIFPFFRTTGSPRLFHDWSARPIRGYACRFRQNIYALKCALFRFSGRACKIGSKYYGRIDRIFYRVDALKYSR